MCHRSIWRRDGTTGTTPTLEKQQDLTTRRSPAWGMRQGEDDGGVGDGQQFTFAFSCRLLLGRLCAARLGLGKWQLL